MSNLVNFYPTTQKSENFFSMGSFCPKDTRFDPQKYRGVIFHGNEQWFYDENLNKPWHCGFKNGMKNIVNFHWSTQKSEILFFDGLFLSKAYNVSARKLRRNYVSWYWRMGTQNLKKNRPVVLIMTQLTSYTILFGQKTFFSIIKVVFLGKREFYLFFYNAIFKDRLLIK